MIIVIEQGTEVRTRGRRGHEEVRSRVKIEERAERCQELAVLLGLGPLEVLIWEDRKW